MMRRIVWLCAAVGGALSLSMGCGGNGSSGSSRTTLVPGTWTPSTGTGSPTPTPTGTPAGPVFLGSFHTPDGENVVPMGKCLGFTVIANDALGTTFDPAATVTVGDLSGFKTYWLDSKHLRVGSDETGGACTFLPIFHDAETVDVTIDSGADHWTLPAAIEITPPELHDAGFVSPDQVFTRDYMTDPGANTFEQPYDVDIYKVTTSDIVRNYPHLDFFDLSGSGLVPSVEFWNKRWPDDLLGRGANAVIFPENGENYFVVRDVQGKGGPGADYDLGFSGDELGWVQDGSGCSNAQPLTAGAYHIDDAMLSNAVDPDNGSGCLDSTFGTPIKGSGPDAMFTVTVPAGKTLRAAAYDNHWSQAIYLLPQTGDSCSHVPPTCTRAAGFFGGGNTNLLEYANTTGADQNFYLVFDTTAVTGTSDGAFLINMEILDRK